jgi:predicted transcriptional regulator
LIKKYFFFAFLLDNIIRMDYIGFMKSKNFDSKNKKKAIPDKLTQAAFYNFLINSAGKTQTEIAKHLGVSISLVNRVIMGERRNEKIKNYILSLQAEDKAINIIFN